jgi:mannose-1-phosphate guanylyltransferase/mannose-6-phosphate isomerase
MIAVIIAGGSGTRLWPLSTPEKPKHTLDLIGEKSLTRQTYDRAKQISDTVYIVTEASHADDIKQQLPELDNKNFLIEPARRGTASCIVMALEYISRHHEADEEIAFLHADHYIRDIEGFTSSFKIAAATSKEMRRISLVGVEPSYPSTGFGYIEKSDPVRIDSIVHSVAAFKEKPDFETAREYVDSGRYLWNCGYFVGTLDTFLENMKNHAPNLLENYEKLQNNSEDRDAYHQTYLDFENETIDVALIEKVENLLSVPATFDWMDVGSFKDLHSANSTDEAGCFSQGEAIHAVEVENSYLRNDENKPLAVIGLDNVVVVNTPDGVLVARKDMSQQVGEIAKKITNQT